MSHSIVTSTVWQRNGHMLYSFNTNSNPWARIWPLALFKSEILDVYSWMIQHYSKIQIWPPASLAKFIIYFQIISATLK